MGLEDQLNMFIHCWYQQAVSRHVPLGTGVSQRHFRCITVLMPPSNPTREKTGDRETVKGAQESYDRGSGHTSVYKWRGGSDWREEVDAVKNRQRSIP